MVKSIEDVKTIRTLAQVLYFSPTGSTRKITSKIAENTGLQAATQIDLTLPPQRIPFTGKIDGNLLIVGTPVYGGSIPYPFLESLQRLHGEGKWAVPVAVYGNRSPDTAIEELVKVLRGRGFKILAAASFVAQHSFATPQHPWATGRPDEADMKAVARFGEEVGKKLKSRPAEISVPGLLMAYSWGFAVPQDKTSIMVEALPEGYHKRVLKRAKSLWRVSVSDGKDCTGCRECADVCPVAAIGSRTLNIDDDLCIMCMACVRSGPKGVMKLEYSDSPSALETFANLDKIFAIRKEAKTFL